MNAPLICPVCKSNQTHFALKVKDHSISGEYFDIFECKRCSLRFTKDSPPEDKIGLYYQSEDYISHSNTRKGLVNYSLSHRIRNKTLATKFRLIKKTTGIKHGHHLDIGAGTGAFVQYMNQHGWESSRASNPMKKLAARLRSIIIQNYYPRKHWKVFYRGVLMPSVYGMCLNMFMIFIPICIRLKKF